MEALGEHWTRAELRAFNRCRLYCRAFFLSDIVTGDGKRIDPAMFHGSSRVSSTLTWPQQQQLGDKDWAIWRKMLKQDFLTETGQLRTLLRAWYDDPRQHHKVWLAYTDKTGSNYGEQSYQHGRILQFCCSIDNEE